MKKKISILFLLLANMVMFAHVIVPHHHHSLNEICVEEIHCESGCDSEQKENHNHHDAEDYQTCSQNLLLFQQSNSISNSISKTLILKVFSCDFSQNASIIFYSPAFFQLQNQYTYSYIIQDRCVLTNVGLRAPPIV